MSVADGISPFHFIKTKEYHISVLCCFPLAFNLGVCVCACVCKLLNCVFQCLEGVL